MHYRIVNFLRYGCPGDTQLPDRQHQLLPFHRLYGSVRKKPPVTGADSPQESCLFLEIGARKESSVCLVASRCYKSLGEVEGCRETQLLRLQRLCCIADTPSGRVSCSAVSGFGSCRPQRGTGCSGSGDTKGFAFTLPFGAQPGVRPRVRGMAQPQGVTVHLFHASFSASCKLGKCESVFCAV